jgi:RNA polymerase sigma factor (sigma-70 family)
VDYARVDDAGLLAAIAAGEQDAFAAFYRRWLPVVTGFHLRRTRSRELAFDLTAETFAAVIVSSGRFRPERGPAAAWLFAIAEHKLADSRRRSRVESSARRRLRLEPVVLEDADLARVEELASQGDHARLAELLASLPESQRTAIRARVLDERSYADIAGELHCSRAVVRQQVSRGLASIREQLKETT